MSKKLQSGRGQVRSCELCWDEVLVFGGGTKKLLCRKCRERFGGQKK